MDAKSSNLQRYLDQMVMIKRRLSVIDNVFNKKTTTGYLYSDIEICTLQLRKIVELIAMGSMVSNIEKYAEIRDTYKNDWNAKYVFADIERINSNFYPVPINIDK